MQAGIQSPGVGGEVCVRGQRKREHRAQEEDKHTCTIVHVCTCGKVKSQEKGMCRSSGGEGVCSKGKERERSTKRKNGEEGKEE